MMMVTLTLFHMADSKEQLDQDTERFLSIARERMCQLAVMSYEQMDAFQTVLPIGPRKVHAASHAKPGGRQCKKGKETPCDLR